ncbi:MAG: aspartate kinase [Bdellovibrionales bacterium]|nr:aspartate kinase [Bdellovibrionales bacterium]
MTKRPLIIQKYGGMSLATAQHIRTAARRVAKLRAGGHDVIVVVSAMGSSTDQLIQQAYAVSETPNRRELDMLLSTGERVSMALFSMALSDALAELAPEARALSFTGSQAGILTDETHSNARIVDLKAIRVEEELGRGNVVILAGFQGVSPITKEITTLGRGGTDVTAVALAAAFHADRCEILKEVPGVLSADPKTVPAARPLTNLSHEQLLDMTFWGAKVLHYRSVELAMTHGVPVFVGLAHATTDQQLETFTQITNATKASARNPSEEKSMSYEKSTVLAVTSHADVRQIKMRISKSTAAHDPALSFGSPISQVLKKISEALSKKRLPMPQLLDVTGPVADGSEICFLMTAPSEALNAQVGALEDNGFQADTTAFCTVTATCQGAYATDFPTVLAEKLASAGIVIHKMIFGPLSITFVLPAEQRTESVTVLHSFST